MADHVWGLLDARPQVFLVDGELAVDGPDVAAPQLGLDLLLLLKVLILQPDVTPLVVGWHHVLDFQVLDPCIVLKCIFQYFLEPSDVLYYSGELVLGVNGES